MNRRSCLVIFVAVLFSPFAQAALSYKSIEIVYRFGEKTVTHRVESETRKLSTYASDRAEKMGRSLSPDDLVFLDEQMKELGESKDKISSCKLSYVEFKIQNASSGEKTFVICRNAKSARSSATDTLLTVLAP